MQTNQTSQPSSATPEAGASPAASVTSSATITIVGADGTKQTLTVPKTVAEIEELRLQRQDLTERLSETSSRADQLRAEIANTSDEGDRAGLQERIRLVDQQILQIETGLASTSQRLASAPANLLAKSEVPQPRAEGVDYFPQGLAVGSFSTLVIVGVALFLRRKRRKSPPQPTSLVPGESADRMDRLERGVEAIAIEIERISEGQRFVTKLMSESKQPIAESHRIEEVGR